MELELQMARCEPPAVLLQGKCDCMVCQPKYAAEVEVQHTVADLVSAELPAMDASRSRKAIGCVRADAIAGIMHGRSFTTSMHAFS